MQRNELVQFLDEYLCHSEVKEPYGTNGLQVEGKAEVKRVGFAVDACLQSFQALEDCDFVIVHHGLFWPSIRSIKGAMKKNLAFLFERDISLYASHLPLDVHPEVGNNAGLIAEMGWAQGERFDAVGYFAEGPARSRQEFLEWGQDKLGAVRLLEFGPEKIERVAVSSGGGSLGMLSAAKKGGAQLFLTGEASHPIYHAAKEMEMNVMLGGHYATETFGVRALQRLLEERFQLDTGWVDFPTGF